VHMWVWGTQEVKQEVSTSQTSLQPAPQRLGGLVELADIIYEDLQSCYGIYASLFHG
jgi:BAI1-associated protein 3